MGGVIGSNVAATGTSSLRLYTGCGNWTYGFEYSNYHDDSLFEAYVDRQTGQYVSKESDFVSFFRFWGTHSGRGYRGMSLGIGAGESYKATDCDDNELFSAKRVCDIDREVVIGIPLRAEAFFGRYIGVGVSVQALITTSERLRLSLNFSIPIGVYHK